MLVTADRCFENLGSAPNSGRLIASQNGANLPLRRTMSVIQQSFVEKTPCGAAPGRHLTTLERIGDQPHALREGRTA